MFQIVQNPIMIGCIAFVLAMLSTLVVRSAAGRFGFVAKPKSDRWHKRPTAMLGGVAIFAATLAVYGLFVPKTYESLVVIGGSAFLFVVGLIDDILNIKPYQKLFGQLIGTAVIVGSGLSLPITGYELIDISITVFWLIGITNAVNLLDNMDGLAAGIALIAAASLALGLWSDGRTPELMLTMAFIGALAGFLVFNFNPASIFMGDCGSMFVGFLLAGSVLLSNSGGRSRGIFTIMAVPVLILFVPIFDTTLVTILRKLWGRKASQGGRDHTSHRLVALGLSERSAVLMIYLFAIAAGGLSLLVSRLEVTLSLALIAVFTIVLTITGVYLSKVKVYEEADEDLAANNNAVFAFIVNVSYKRRIFEIFLDVFLVTLAYYGSYVLLFGPFENSSNWNLFLKTLPLVVILKLFAFLAGGVYRGLWRYTSVSDLFTFAKSVVLGSVLSVLGIVLLFRFDGFSRKLFVLDCFLLFLALAGSRLAFRLFREFIPTPAGSGRRVLIYGAGDGGEMVLRELRNNPAWEYQAVGFVDDDPFKVGKVINGLRVYEGGDGVVAACSELQIDEILISTNKISGDILDKVRRIGGDHEIEVKRVRLVIEPLGFE